MVFNNTKVIQARLHFRKETGATIEVFCLEPEQPADYQLMFQETKECVWQCLVGNSSRWKSGVLSQMIEIDGVQVTLSVERVSSAAVNLVRFFWDGGFTFAQLLEAAGVDTVKELAHRRADNLAAKMVEVNEEKHLVRRVPVEKEVQKMIDQAKELPAKMTY